MFSCRFIPQIRSNPLRAASDVHHLQHLFYLWYDGLHGGKPARDGLFRISHDCFAGGGLRLADCVDFYYFCGMADADGTISVLSGVLGDYNSGSCGDLPEDSETISERRCLENIFCSKNLTILRI